MADLVQEEQRVVGIDEEGQNKGTESEGNSTNRRIHLEGQGEKDMQGNSIHRSSSRPQLDVSKAEIQSNVEDKYPTILLPNQSDDLSHLALDIGGMSCVCDSDQCFMLLVKLFAFLTSFLLVCIVMIFVLFILLLYMVFVVFYGGG